MKELWDVLVDFIYSCFLSMAEMIKDAFIWAFDGFLGVCILALDGIGSLFGALNVTQYLSFIPDETRNIMALIGLDQATSIIVSAIIIRITLQLIPFVRLGS